MTTKINKRTATLLRSLPGMEKTEGRVRLMSDLGQAVLTTALLLPRRKAEILIDWIAKEIRAGRQTAAVDLDAIISGPADSGPYKWPVREVPVVDVISSVDEMATRQASVLDRHEAAVKRTRELSEQIRGAARRLKSR